MSTKITTSHHWIAFVVTSTVSLCVYLLTLSPSIAGGDSGELVAEGCQLGTSHPPGYPLYTIIVYLATTVGRYLLPWKSPAYCVNITSAIFGAAASGFLSSCILYLIAIRGTSNHHYGKSTKKKGSKRFTNKKPSCEDYSLVTIDNDVDYSCLDMYISIFVGLMNSFSPLTWQYSVTAEVFALHNLFVSVIVNTTLRFASFGRKSDMLLGAFFCGLSLTNQHTSVLLVFPMIIWVLHATKLCGLNQDKKNVTDKNQIQGRSISPLILAAMYFLSGFVALYFTLPVFQQFFPHQGSWGDVTSIRGFFHHLSRKDYGSLRLYSGNDNGSENAWERFSLWITDFTWSQSLPFVCIASIIACKDALIEEIRKRRTRNGRNDHYYGMILLAEEDRVGLDTTIALSLVFYLFVFHTLANLPLKNPLFFGIHQRFWMHPNILFFILSGLGLKKFIHKFTQGSDTRMAFSKSVLVVILSYAFHRGYKMSDQSHAVYFKNYANSILKTLPQNAVLFINYDQQWTSIRYMQECEGVRKDVTSINLSMMSYEWFSKKHNLYPNITFPGTHYTFQGGKGFTFSRLLDANNAFNGKAFIGGRLSYQDPSYSHHFDEIPHGIVRKIITKGADKDSTAESYRKESKKVWETIAKEHPGGLPPLLQYKDDTWEWTIRREFFDHFVSRASHLLDLAVSEHNKNSNESKLISTVEATAWLESAKLNDEMIRNSPATWKNLGLAYLNLVRSSETNFPQVENIFKNTENSFLFESIGDVWWDVHNNSGMDWKSWSSMKWESNWAHYLKMDDAKNEISYQQVKTIYDKVLASVTKKE